VSEFVNLNWRNETSGDETKLSFNEGACEPSRRKYSRAYTCAESEKIPTVLVQVSDIASYVSFELRLKDKILSTLVPIYLDQFHASP